MRWGINFNLKNKYRRPRTFWNKAAIADRNNIRKEYGLRRVREILIVSTGLRQKFDEIRGYILSGTLGERFYHATSNYRRLGLLNEDSVATDLFSLNIPDVLERRLQTIVYRRGLARTIRAARQLVLHRKISYQGRINNIPSMLIPISMEGEVQLV